MSRYEVHDDLSDAEMVEALDKLAQRLEGGCQEDIAESLRCAMRRIAKLSDEDCEDGDYSAEEIVLENQFEIDPD